MPDSRIQLLSEEVDRLRSFRHASDNHLQSLVLKVTEIQLNLATQDKTLAKLESSIHGNGKPGLITRMDRVERIAGGLVKAVWLLTTAIGTAMVKIVVDRMK
jgi:hypothetical protein